ncbi:hypothetical protein MRX96_037453 [Rhipicephalus microplus]
MKAVFTLPEKTHGPGPVFFTWQKASGNYLVTTGYDQTVNVYDRHGDRKDQISLPGMCTGLGYDKDGDTLGIITDRSGAAFLVGREHPAAGPGGHGPQGCVDATSVGQDGAFSGYWNLQGKPSYLPSPILQKGAHFGKACQKDHLWRLEPAKHVGLGW